MAEVETAREGAVLTITLNRPDSYNAFTTTMHAELLAALGDAAAEDVRAVVITGAGKGFCAGQDLSEFRGLEHDVGEHLEASYHPNARAIRGLDKPVIAAVNGVAAGAGISLAVLCDYRIAADNSAYVPGFIGIGLIPDSGGSYFLARLLGPSRAFAWMSSNRKLTAAEAQAFGLVDEVVEADGLLDRAAELAAHYASLPTRGIGMTKKLLDHAQGATLEEQLALEARMQTEATKSADFMEGVSAFLEKRPPSFTGR